MKAQAVVDQLVAVSGLPEEFFWADDPGSPMDRRLSEIEEQIRQLSAQTAARVAEVLRRIDDIDQTMRQLRERRQP